MSAVDTHGHGVSTALDLAIIVIFINRIIKVADETCRISIISNMMAIPRVWLAEFVILFPKLKMISVFSRVKIKKNARSQTNIPPLNILISLVVRGVIITLTKKCPAGMIHFLYNLWQFYGN